MQVAARGSGFLAPLVFSCSATCGGGGARGLVCPLRGCAFQGVTWTGVLNSRRVAVGLKVDWAYAPGEVKVLTSSDGANFEEARCWQTSTRAEVAFEESFMFDTARSVKAVSIVMRGPQSWGYFGINSAALVAESGPFMLVRCFVVASFATRSF